MIMLVGLFILPTLGVMLFLGFMVLTWVWFILIDVIGKYATKIK
jgi:hypothetical protein